MIVRLFFVLFLAAGLVNVCYGQDDDYAVDNIPKELLKNANVVIRMYHSSITITSASEVAIDNVYAITILNEKGKEHRALKIGYDKIMSIQSVRGWLYDKDGNVVAKMRMSDLKDVAALNGNFYDEERFKFFDFGRSEYPYTCKFEVTTKCNTTFVMPSWEPQESYDCAVENADIEIYYPKDIGVHYRTYHSQHEPTVEADGDQNKLTFSVNNILPRPKPDGLTPVEYFQSPALVCIADKFVLEEKEGKFTTWNDFGKFFYDLNSGRDELPEPTKKKVHQMTDSCSSQAKKISLLYQYLQKNTRYVNIILGIGGWRSWDAKYVAEKGYGDCKALSNFMKALLKEAGITSYATLVYGGAHFKKMETDFPSNVFNHVILCVPQGADSVWLECTSHDLPAGFLSPFTSDRNVLLLTPAGGYVARTPRYDENSNLIVRKAVMSINDKDELGGVIDATYEGLWWEKENEILNEGKSKVDDYFNMKYALPSYKVTGYNTTRNIDGKIPVAGEHVLLKGSGSISRSGKQLYISPQVFKLSVNSPFSFEPRKDSFHLSSSYRVTDTTIINTGGVYNPGSRLPEMSYDYPFCNYHSKIFFEQNSILKVCVSYEQHEGTYPPAMFDDYIQLSKKINSGAAYDKIMLIKKD